MKTGFDAEKYLEEQSKFILERIGNDKDTRLYLEFGGKLVQQAVDKYERGLMNPSLATIIRLSEFFEVPVSALFEMD